MRVESIYTTSHLIGDGPRGQTEIHKKELDEKGRARYTVEEHPYISYSSTGKLETAKIVGTNIDKQA